MAQHRDRLDLWIRWRCGRQLLPVQRDSCNSRFLCSLGVLAKARPALRNLGARRYNAQKNTSFKLATSIGRPSGGSMKHVDQVLALLKKQIGNDEEVKDIGKTASQARVMQPRSWIRCCL